MGSRLKKQERLWRKLTQQFSRVRNTSIVPDVEIVRRIEPNITHPCEPKTSAPKSFNTNFKLLY